MLKAASPRIAAARWLLCALAGACPLQASPASDPGPPDVTTLLRQVEAHQAQLDRVREDYTYHEVQTLTVVDNKGKVRRYDSKEKYVFFVRGHQIQELIGRDGKPLSADEAKKEQERATREAKKYASAPEGLADRDEISVSRLLQIVTFSHPRRVMEGGRSTIAVDFVGDPHAKTSGRNEDAIKRVRGTVWVDEAAREVSHMDAVFDSNLHIGWGVLAVLEKGSTFSFRQGLVHNEVWLPTAMVGHFDGKAMVFVGFHANLAIRYDDYRKFGAEATELPGATTAEAH